MHAWYPLSPSYRRGRLLLFIAILYHTITLSLRIAFDIPFEGLWFYADLLADALLLADIWVGMHTAYNQGNHIEDRPQMTRRHYWRTRGPWELLAILPFDYILLALTPGLGPVALATCRLNRLLRWVTLGRIFPLAGQVGVRNLTLFRITKLALAVLVGAHLVACAWYLIGGVFGDPTDNWMIDEGIADASIGVKYLYSLYWAVTTMSTVGYGDITPSNPTEVLFTIFAMLAGVTTWAYVIATIANMIANREGRATLYRDKMSSVNQYMEYYKIPSQLQSRIRDYYDYLWLRNRAEHYNDALNDLSHPLRTELGLYLNRDLIERVPLFTDATEGFKRSLARCLRPSIFAPGDLIVHAGEIGHEMYFLSQGEVEVLDNDTAEVLHTLTPGNFFGEMALLRCEKRTHTLRAKGFCDVAILEKGDFDSALCSYPEFAEVVHSIVRERESASV